MAKTIDETEAAVRRIVLELKESGKRPTLRLVKAQLGYGSNTTLLPILHKIEAEDLGNVGFTLYEREGDALVKAIRRDAEAKLARQLESLQADFDAELELKALTLHDLESRLAATDSQLTAVLERAIRAETILSERLNTEHSLSELHACLNALQEGQNGLRLSHQAALDQSTATLLTKLRALEPPGGWASLAAVLSKLHDSLDSPRAPSGADKDLQAKIDALQKKLGVLEAEHNQDRRGLRRAQQDLTKASEENQELRREVELLREARDTRAAEAVMHFERAKQLEKANQTLTEELTVTKSIAEQVKRLDKLLRANLPTV